MLRPLLLAFACAISTIAAGQPYPERPVKVIVPFLAGGAADIVAREIAPHLSAAMGKPFIVENLPGSGGAAGARAAAQAPADGYVLLMATDATLVTGRLMTPSSNYEPLSSFAPISLVSAMPLMAGVGRASPAADFAALVKAIKEAPGRLRYAVTPGTSALLAGAMFRSEGMEIREVRVGGWPAAVAALDRGEVDIVFGAARFFENARDDARIRPLVVLGRNRYAPMLQLPSVVDLNFPELRMHVWSGLVAPAGTPRPVVDRLNDALRTVLASPDLQRAFFAMGLTTEYSSPEQFAGFVRAELERWTPALKPN